MKCTMQWSNPEFDYDADRKDQPHEILLQRHRNGGYRNGCQKEAVYELRQFKDWKKKDPNDTFHIGFNCDLHVPKKTAQNYIITEIS